MAKSRPITNLSHLAALSLHLLYGFAHYISFGTSDEKNHMQFHLTPTLANTRPNRTTLMFSVNVSLSLIHCVIKLYEGGHYVSYDMDILEDNLPKRASDCISVNAPTIGPHDRLPAAGILVRFRPCQTTVEATNTQKEILSRVFLSQCCHMYGSQAWALDACHIKSFCSTWRKAVRKLWGLPNIARSALVPHLVNAPPIEDQLYQRTAKMYNGIRKSHNPKLLLLLQLSTNADKMGIMGNNTRIISNRWLCGFNRLERNFVDR